MTGLVGWWPLHENSGSNARDLSGNGNHGTLNGGVTQGVAGKGGLTAYSCNGSDSYVNVGEKSVLRPEKFTLSARVRFSSVGSNYQLVVDQDEEVGKGGYRIILNSDATLSFSVNDNGTSYSIKSETLESNKWYHLLMKFDGSSLTAYIDGQKVDSKSATLSYPNPEPFVIAGRHKNGSYDLPLNGTINDVRLYNRALSEQEVQALYDWGSGDYTDRSYHDGSDSGAVSRWKFDGDVTDSWGGNGGTDNTSAGFSSDAIRGRAKNFDGDDDIVDLGGWGVSTQEFTISSWINSSDVTSHQKIVEQWASSDGNFILDLGYTNSTARLLVEDSQNSNYVTETPSELKNNAWYHIVGGYDGSETFIYLNGVLRASNQLDITRNTSDYATGIGADPSNSQQYFNGKIDDVRIYKRALSPSEVFQLYQWGTRGRDMRNLTVNQR